MPKGMRKPVSRVGIRIPKPMTDEINRIIDSHPALYYNRQQFVETAIREKIERIKAMERGLSLDDLNRLVAKANRQIDERNKRIQK